MAEADEIAFSEGQQAFDRGEDQIICPHVAGSRDGCFWLAGWDEAKRYADRCLNQTVMEPPADLAPVLRFLPLPAGSFDGARSVQVSDRRKRGLQGFAPSR